MSKSKDKTCMCACHWSTAFEKNLPQNIHCGLCTFKQKIKDKFVGDLWNDPYSLCDDVVESTIKEVERNLIDNLDILCKKCDAYKNCQTRCGVFKTTKRYIRKILKEVIK